VSSLLSEQNPDFPRHRGALMTMFGRAGEAGLASALLALANRPDRRESLRALRAVAVAVAGDADLLIPPDRAREIAAAIPGAKLVLLPGIAHLSVMEAPREVAEALTCCG
jgi:pimeloyl-ACP methyl ester carboxylesterase